MTPKPVPEPPMSEAGRLAGVYFDPGRTFADVAARPRWWPPMLILVVAGVVMMTCFSQCVGWERAVRHQVESNERMQNLPADQREQAIERGVKIGSVMGYVGVVVGTPVVMVVIAVVLMAVFNSVFAAEIRFKRALAATAYASMTGLVLMMLSILVMYIKSPDDYDIQNPLAFNLGAFLGSEAPKWLKVLAGSFDLFTFWTIALLGLAFAAAAARKMAWSKAVLGVVLPWIVWVGLKTGAAALF